MGAFQTSISHPLDKPITRDKPTKVFEGIHATLFEVFHGLIRSKVPGKTRLHLPDPRNDRQALEALASQAKERNRLRVQGRATLGAEDPLLGDYPEAELIVRVAVTHVMVNCPRYPHKMQRVAHEDGSDLITLA